MRILLLTKNVPWPGNSGEKIRSQGVANALSTLGDVTVIGFVDEHDEPALGEREGFRIVAVPARRSYATMLRGLRRAGSLTASKYSDRSFRTRVREELAQGVDLCVVEHVQLAHHVPESAGSSVLHLDMHNIESSLTHRLATTTRGLRRAVYALEARALRRLERRSGRRFSSISVVSDVDREVLERMTGRRDILVVPNAITAPDDVPPHPPAPAVCYVGLMSWAPNVDAAIWFAREVWPRVVESVPEAKLFIVGRDPAPAVQELASDAVVVTGTVASVGEWYGRSSLAVAPLLAGGGSRLKILEALTYGRPVVATEIGAEGLEPLVGQGVFTGTEAAQLADQVATLLSDTQQCQEAGAKGRDAVMSLYSWPVATRGLVDHLSQGDQ